MRRRSSEVPIDIEVPKKKYVLSSKSSQTIKDGEILCDIYKNKWRIGRTVGVGGFGEIYLASNEITKPVTQDAQYVIKVEPHRNGPLFVEMNFYIRAARENMINDWLKRRRQKEIGMPCYCGSGSHVYKGEKYRFLVLNRYGQDLSKMFVQFGRKFNLKTVLVLAIKIVNILEYIHHHGYIHCDVKGSNLLLTKKGKNDNQAYLLDYGLACRYRESDGSHKEYVSDIRKAHNGTIEYTSRDQHIGAHSRRGDLEVLGYNLLQWLCKKLPWETDCMDPELVHKQKIAFMSNIPGHMKQCFPESSPPDVLIRYFKYVASLRFEAEPDYAYCREILKQGFKEAGLKFTTKIEFGETDHSIQNVRVGKTKSKKRKATDEPENLDQIKPKKISRNNSLRQPCKAHNYNRVTRNSPAVMAPVLRSHQPFSWEKVLQSDPEILLKKPVTNSVAVKKQPAVPSRRNLVNQVQASVASSDCPTNLTARDRIQLERDKLSLQNPTPTMLEIMSKVKQRSGLKKNKSDSRSSTPSEVQFSQPLTSAMMKVLRNRNKSQSKERLCDIKKEAEDVDCLEEYSDICSDSYWGEEYQADDLLDSDYESRDAHPKSKAYKQKTNYGFRRRNIQNYRSRSSSPFLPTRILRNNILKG